MTRHLIEYFSIDEKVEDLLTKPMSRKILEWSNFFSGVVRIYFFFSNRK
jgi:hypothetical protein